MGDHHRFAAPVQAGPLGGAPTTRPPMSSFRFAVRPHSGRTEVNKSLNYSPAKWTDFSTKETTATLPPKFPLFAGLAGKTCSVSAPGRWSSSAAPPECAGNIGSRPPERAMAQLQSDFPSTTDPGRRAWWEQLRRRSSNEASSRLWGASLSNKPTRNHPPGARPMTDLLQNQTFAHPSGSALRYNFSIPRPGPGFSSITANPPPAITPWPE